MEAQKRLFEVIKSKIPDQYRLADVIEELLNVGTDAAYRRIRGETELSFSQLVKICEKFNLSMDEFLNYKSSQGALFSYGPVTLSDQNSFISNLNTLLERFTILKSSAEKEFCFSALDIPFYHFAKFPELVFFKQYVWNDTMSRKSVPYNEFYRDLEKDKIVSIFEKIHNTDMMIPSKEVWTNQTVDTILRLIEHYYEIGAFESKKTVALLLEQLSGLLDMIKQFADDGYKGGERKTPFNLYLCPVDLESTFMLIRSEKRMFCTVRLSTVNTISTDNEFICMRIQKWFDDLVSKSTQISSISVKERFRFFQASKNKIEELLEKIEKIEKN